MRILFQGDSVTDAGRDREDFADLGFGYPVYAAQVIRSALPERDIEFVNKGISGNRSCDLLDRWQEDCIDLQPDVVSILIGINDTWRRFDSNDPTSAAQFEENYRGLLEDIRKNTSAKIVLVDPFVLPVDRTKDFWRIDLDEKIQVVRRVAKDYADVYLPLDGILASHCLSEPPEHWTDDGVHPNEDGAKLIGKLLAEAILPLI